MGNIRTLHSLPCLPMIHHDMPTLEPHKMPNTECEWYAVYTACETQLQSVVVSTHPHQMTRPQLGMKIEVNYMGALHQDHTMISSTFIVTSYVRIYWSCVNSNTLIFAAS